jgi:hypothetical protein
MHNHGPENAEFEIRKAYNIVMESGVTHFWQNRVIEGVNPQEAFDTYKRAYNCLRRGDRLAAERWARAAKHLSRAFWCEAKIAFLLSHSTDLPYLEGATPEELQLHERSDTTEDLLNSVADHIPPGLGTMPPLMLHYLARARRHLQGKGGNELLRAERIKAAHEYGRVLEIMALGYEAENAQKRAAA